jgi:glycine oxidase
MRIGIIGCGIIGALLAYELGQRGQHSVIVLEQAAEPAQGATGAALGVLMGVISHKLKGRPWRFRQISLERYEQLIPELETITGLQIRFNRQGLLKLLFAEDDLHRWRYIVDRRRQQGYSLHWLEPTLVTERVPGLNPELVRAGIVSPSDRQLDPSQLTQALVQAASQHGVEFRFGSAVEQVQVENDCAVALVTHQMSLPLDYLVITAGIGSFPLTQGLLSPLPVQPVLGQAAKLYIPQGLAVSPEPVLTGRDIHFVPLGDRHYWLGATVELPPGLSPETARSEAWTELWHSALAMCPGLAQADVLGRWQGWRPRPVGRSAPVIEPLAGYTNVILATAHYRNGVLLAPATAQEVLKLIDYG